MIFYKIGCYAMILTGLMHLSTEFRETAPANETEKQLLELMTTYQIDVGNGATVTMFGIQKGFSWWFTLTLIWIGSMSLLLAKPLKENPSALRKIAFVNTGALILGTGISVVFFFFIPTTCISLCLIFFALAAIRVK